MPLPFFAIYSKLGTKAGVSAAQGVLDKTDRDAVRRGLAMVRMLARALMQPLLGNAYLANRRPLNRLG